MGLQGRKPSQGPELPAEGGETAMPRFLFEARYTAEGARGLSAEGGTKRREAVEKTLQSLGGRLEAFYYALGKFDLYFVAELPDNAAAAALSLAVAGSGAATLRTTALLTAEEMDGAARAQTGYRPPGR